MKKLTLYIIFLLLISCTEVGNLILNPDNDINDKWTITTFVDDSGNKTSIEYNSYITTGFFSNASTIRSPLTVEFIITGDKAGIFLKENNTTTTYLRGGGIIKLKNEDYEELELIISSTKWNRSGGNVIYNITNLINFLSTSKGEIDVRVFSRQTAFTRQTATVYLFTLYSLSYE